MLLQVTSCDCNVLCPLPYFFIRFITLIFLHFTAQEMEDILQMFDENVKGVYGNHTCISLQTSIDEEDENLTSHHHRHLRKF